MLNASLATIIAGKRPNMTYKDARERTLLVFGNGQIRRVPGEGHSTEERAIRRARRNADYACRRLYKRGRASDDAAQRNDGG